MKQKISKVEIVCLQINKACELHLASDFGCSLTLGGSAESLSCELVESRGHESVNSWHEKFIRYVRERAGMQSPSKKDIHNQKNWARNSIKHHKLHESEVIEINLEFESFLVIKRSIENYQRLGEVRTEKMDNFNEKTREYG